MSDPRWATVGEGIRAHIIIKINGNGRPITACNRELLGDVNNDAISGKKCERCLVISQLIGKNPVQEERRPEKQIEKKPELSIFWRK